MQAISVFNNKGGVGKTTLLCNLAAFLALERKKRVLVIDADPQCNTTQLTFSDQQIEQLYENPKSFTIYSVIHPLSQGKGYTQNFEARPLQNFGFDILIGDPRLSLKEDLLARDWSAAMGGDIRGLRTSYLFVELVSRCRDYDYVFFDVGPSLGSINRSVLLASNFFISPMTIDIFSLKAIENIRISIENWKKQLKTCLENLEDTEGLPEGDPKDFNLKFAGYVTQQYKAKSDGSGGLVAVEAYEKINKKVAPTIKTNFIDRLQSSTGRITYKLGTIPNLYSLVPMAQFARKPIFALKSSDGVRGAHFSKVRESHELFENIADLFEKNIEQLK